MKNITEPHGACPVEATLSVIGSKWTVLIIRDLLTGTKRFGELQKSLSGISPRTLSLRLSELEEMQVIEKKIYPVMPPKVEYTLTVSGKSLAAIITKMREWGDKHVGHKRNVEKTVFVK